MPLKIINNAIQLDEEELAKSVYSERLHQYMERERNAAASGPLVSAYLAVLYSDRIEISIIIGWWLALFLFDVTTTSIAHRYLRDLPKTKLQSYYHLVLIPKTLAAIVWGSSVHFFHTNSQSISELYIYTVLIAVSSINCIVLLPFRKAFLCFVFGLWTFPIAYCLTLTEPIYFNIAIGLCLMLITLIIFQSTTTQQFNDGIVQKLRAGALAKKLELSLIQIEELAMYDDLTGAYNRRYGNEYLSREKAAQVRYGHKLSLVIIDIDYFKRINDTHGHSTGDTVLVNFTECIQNLLRETDILIRYGGEEFIIAMPQTSQEQAVFFLERLREKISDSSLCNDTELKVTASFGLAEIMLEETIEEAINRADKALYNSKDAGRNRLTVAK